MKKAFFVLYTFVTASSFCPGMESGQKMPTDSTQKPPLQTEAILTSVRITDFMDWCKENIGKGSRKRKQSGKLKTESTTSLITASINQQKKLRAFHKRHGYHDTYHGCKDPFFFSIEGEDTSKTTGEKIEKYKRIINRLEKEYLEGETVFSRFCSLSWTKKLEKRIRSLEKKLGNP